MAAMSGVSAIQQNHVRLNGAKQAAYNNPLQIAASHGQSFVILFMGPANSKSKASTFKERRLACPAGASPQTEAAVDFNVTAGKPSLLDYLLSFRAKSRNF